MTRLRAVLIASSCAVTMGSLAQDPVYVATDSQNRLVYRVEYPLPVQLELSAFEQFEGWISFGVGFEPISEDEPQNGMFALPEASDIEFVVLAADQNMHVFNRERTQFLEIGEAYHLGNPYFHHHPTWNLTEGNAGEWRTLTIQFRDRTGTYADSDPLVMTFVTVPSAASLSVLAAASAFGIRRRRTA